MILGENIGVWGYNGKTWGTGWKTLAVGGTVAVGYRVDSGFFVLQCRENAGMCIGWFASYNSPQVTFLANYVNNPVGSTKDSNNVNLYVNDDANFILQNHSNEVLLYRLVVFGLTNNWF